eukprot:Gregarina_sp_Poly_1__10289@NODE_723_length_6600_cov_64_797949_g543_i0_p5_GENE_NODE_723_length_6600_cov_64_797949_g543_i0NODE_723_length_6600_cov_64_797949_g543_i0_p5_ORF_typecomplete_len118_score13_70_NODE_723_length_6600_cov_64_797949_g543_i027733126
MNGKRRRGSSANITPSKQRRVRSGGPLHERIEEDSSTTIQANERTETVPMATFLRWFLGLLNDCSQGKRVNIAATVRDFRANIKCNATRERISVKCLSQMLRCGTPLGYWTHAQLRC